MVGLTTGFEFLNTILIINSGLMMELSVIFVNVFSLNKLIIVVQFKDVNTDFVSIS